MNRDQIKDLLTTHATTIVFTKKDGTEREMLCTLDEDRIPSDKLPSGEAKVKINESVLPVFDLTLGEWRSFRIDSVKEIKL